MEPELASATTVLSKEHELFAIGAKDFGAFMIDGAGDDPVIYIGSGYNIVANSCLQ